MLDQSYFANNPGPIIEYLNQSSSVSLILLDNNMQIKDCNQFFLKIIETGQKPVGINLKEFLVPENHHLATNPPEAKSLNIRYTLLSGQGNPTNMIGGFYKLNHDYLLLGERAWIDDDQVIHEISKMNNELANMTRELNKKNIALEKLNAEVNNLLRTDALTGIANRRYFLEYFQKMHAYAIRHAIPLSIVMADLDHFKAINDQFGHFFGDKVLKEFASLLLNNCRGEDMAARFGGEEFIVLLLHATGQDAVIHAERVRSEVEAHSIGENNIKITASFGVTSMKQADNIETLMNRADDALYKAKKAGRNTVELC